MIHYSYEVRWPWRDDHDILPSNYGLAIGRLNSLLKRLSTKPNLLNQYDTVISDQLKKGIIEPAPVVPTSPHTHYLPHHCVVKPSHNTTKVRVVYDASAKASKQSPSLNDCLLSGPNLVPDLCGVLLRFRLPRIAISSDIEKAFLQLSLHDEDRDVTRFLWLRDVSLPATPENIQTFRFCRVPFGVVSSPFLLAATVHHHLKNSTCKDAPEHLKNIYVDNLFSGADTDNEAMKQYNSTKKLFSKASMNLREWASNSPMFLQQIPEADRTNTSVQKCLGLLWDTTGDISSSPVDTTSIAVTTKRHVLQAVSKFFDPLGLQSPVLVQAKILMQDIWKLDVDWDDPLPDDTLQRWISIAADLETASSTSYPRFVGAPDPSNASYELHVFCDASASAYGAAVYLTVISDDHRTTNLLFSKSRVAPVQAQTIPRLELMAALLGANVTRFIRKELPLTFRHSYLWSDSTTVLHWLASTEKLPVFVKNRVEAIRAVPHLTYQYVKSCDNPADLPSRGATVSTLQSSNLWWHGPAFLSVSSDQPVILAAGEDPTETTPESSKGSKGLGKSQLAQTKKKSDAHHQQKKICDVSPFGIDVERYSSFTTLVRVTALCARFLSRLRKTESAVGAVTVAETSSAKNRWIQYIQNAHYSDVVTALQKSKPHPLVGKLNLFLDNDNIVRCKGRLANADLVYSARHPVLVPRSHLATTIVMDSHRDVMHAGVPHTLARVRQRFWIPRGRSTVKSTIRQCQTCRRHNAGPYATPAMAPLPSSRVTPARTFARTGIDFFGPIYIKNAPEATKVWVSLFTCMVTRAVHLEMVNDMTTTEFLLAFRRFVARRGMPELVITDNAPQFKVTDAAFQRAFNNTINSTDVLTYLSRNCIRWQFIVESAPWMGGFYEQLVGTVKRALRKVIGKSLLDSTQLYTVLTEVEATINSRPLVYVSDEPEPLTLTPSHFLSLSNNHGGILINSDDDPSDPDFQLASLSTSDRLIEFWKKGQRRLNQAWKSWRDDYLLSLREHQQYTMKQPTTAALSPSTGDVVLVKDDLPRGTWRLGKVVDVHTSADGEIRSATIRTPERRTLRRPVSHLFPVECGIHQVNPPTTPLPATPSTGPGNSVPSRPTRATAVRFRNNLQQLIDNNAV